MTVKVWLERLPNAVKDYEPCNQWNMDELGLFFETLPNKGLVEKEKSSRGGNQSKKRMTIPVFVAADDSSTLPLEINCTDSSSWTLLICRLDRQMKLENCHIILFLDNAPSHPVEFIKLVILPKNTTSTLQPADAEIIHNLKAKYKKRLVRHVVSLLNYKSTASTII